MAAPRFRPLCTLASLQDTKLLRLRYQQNRESFCLKPKTHNLLSADLGQALRDVDIELPDEQVESLDQYRAVLWRWNEQINLTRHTSAREIRQPRCI